jgi:hypothetical protein
MVASATPMMNTAVIPTNIIRVAREGGSTRAISRRSPAMVVPLVFESRPGRGVDIAEWELDETRLQIGTACGRLF